MYESSNNSIGSAQARGTWTRNGKKLLFATATLATLVGASTQAGAQDADSSASGSSNFEGDQQDAGIPGRVGSHDRGSYSDFGDDASECAFDAYMRLNHSSDWAYHNDACYPNDPVVPEPPVAEVVPELAVTVAGPSDFGFYASECALDAYMLANDPSDWAYHNDACYPESPSAGDSASEVQSDLAQAVAIDAHLEGLLSECALDAYMMENNSVDWSYHNDACYPEALPAGEIPSVPEHGVAINAPSRPGFGGSYSIPVGVTPSAVTNFIDHGTAVDAPVRTSHGYTEAAESLDSAAAGWSVVGTDADPVESNADSLCVDDGSDDRLNWGVNTETNAGCWINGAATMSDCVETDTEVFRCPDGQEYGGPNSSREDNVG